MDRVFNSGAAASAPTPPASPSTGYATAGNPGTGTPPTEPGPWWFHMITEELRAVIVAAGLTPDHEDLTQLAAAISALSAVVPDASTSVKGRVQLSTDAEAQALSSAVKALTPSTLKGAFKGVNQSLVANGYQNLPGGLILQWSTVGLTSQAGANFSYPVTFPSACLAIVGSYASPYNASSGGDMGAFQVRSISTSQFNAVQQDNGTGCSATVISIGY